MSGTSFLRATLLLLLLALPAAVHAQPSIAGASGQWSHRGTVTVSGSGFGSKSTAAPVVWDDASTGSILDKWDGAWPNTNPTYNTAYRAPMRGIALPHNRTTRYIAGAHGDANGPQGGTIVAFYKNRTIPSFPAYTYVSWYQRADDAWVFGQDNNYKTFLVSEGGFGYTPPNYWYLAYNVPLPDSRTSGASYIFGADSSGVTVRFPDANGHRQWWDSAVNPMSGVWTKVEMEIKYTSLNDGYIKLWENGTLRVDYFGHTDGMPGNTRSEGIGGYGRMYGQPNNWRYFADVYLDYSRARVILGNAATYDASTVREVQIPQAWSSSSIAITVNLGKFANGQAAYLYVVDPNGRVNQAGFPINTSGGTPDTTPPSVTSATPPNGASNVATTTAATATFSEPMNTSTIGPATFELRDAANVLIPAAVTYNSSTRVATLSPNSALANGRTYTAKVKGGAGGVKDLAGNALAADVMWSFSTTAASTPPPSGSSGLVAAYSFNEVSGTTASDASGANNTGTLAGGATRSVAGKHGAALSLDGVDDWVTVADSTSLDLTNAMTLEAWVKPATLSGWRTVIMKETTDGLAYVLYAHDNAPKPAAYVRMAGRSSSDSVGGAAALPLNAWTHLAATYDGAVVRLFVNGIAVGSVPTSGSIVTTGLPLRIGGNAVWGEFFHGLIDEVRIYNRALSAAEIQSDMSTPIGGVVTPPAPPSNLRVVP